jgi:non-specific serine/threonine protein kinase
MDSKNFGSYWKFVNEHCIVYNEFFGVKVTDKAKDPSAFSKFAKRFILRRGWDIIPNPPTKFIDYVKVPLSRRQKDLYGELSEVAIAELFGPSGEKTEIVVTPNVITTLLRLRQLLVSPKVLSPDESDIGGALEYLTGQIEDEYLARNTIAIFSPFRSGVDAIEGILKTNFSELAIFKIMGGRDMEKNVDVATEFVECKQPKILIGTISAAISYDAPILDATYFIGSDWSFVNNQQAEDRGLRRSRTKITPLRIIYVTHEKSLDSKIVRRFTDAAEYTEQLFIKRSDLELN